MADGQGKSVLVVRTHSDIHSPHYCNADGRREAYVRIGDESVIAPPEVLSELILRGTNRTRDSLDSGIPIERASFTVLKATYALRTGTGLEDVDLASFGLIQLPRREVRPAAARRCGERASEKGEGVDGAAAASSSMMGRQAPTRRL